MSSTPATHHDAELILKLYELRREPVMREARNFVAGFSPKSAADMLGVANAFGTKENAYIRQVFGYWEMVAALIVHGTLNSLLAYDTLGEMYFVYAKIQPFVEEFRQKSGMVEFQVNVQKVVEGSAEGRDRLARMQKRQAEMAAAAR
ncbi:MAG: hypothetical protein WBM04_11695 [Candidatus Korobacteraceae bacterium]